VSCAAQEATSFHLAVSFCCAGVAPIETTSPDVTLHFETDRNCKSSLGFQVKWYAFRYNDGKPCTNEEFLCDKNR